MTRRFPPPWTVEKIPGGFKVVDADGQSLAYVYARETRADADTAKVLTMDEAQRSVGPLSSSDDPRSSPRNPDPCKLAACPVTVAAQFLSRSRISSGFPLGRSLRRAPLVWAVH